MCPTMDLIAACTVNGDVWVARWFSALEKNWTLPSFKYQNEKVETITWRPDGRVLAIGYSSAIIRLFNVDTSDMIHELSRKSMGDYARADSAPIVFLCWEQDSVNNDSETNLYESVYPIEKYLPRLSTLPNSKMSKVLGCSYNKTEHETDDDCNTTTDLLIAGDEHGNLHLSVYGIYNLEPISLSKQMNRKNVQILNTAASLDLSTIALLLKSDDLNPASQSSSDTNTSTTCYTIALFNTGWLHTNKQQIRVLSQRYTTIKYLISYIAEGLRQMETEYKHMKDSEAAHTEPFKEVAEDNKDFWKAQRLPEPTLSVEYCRLLATGKPSKMLAEFVELHSTKRAIKDWENKGIKSLELIRELIHDYIRPACEKLLLQLSALVGYSKWPQKFGELGLEEQSIHACVIITGRLIKRLEELLLAINEERVKFKEFHEWLQMEFDCIVTTERTSAAPAPTNINVERIASYLRHSLNKDIFREFFVKNESATISLSQFDFSLDRQQSSTSLPSRAAYPYDFIHTQECDNESLALQCFIEELAKRCDDVSSSTAHYVAASVSLREYWDFFAEMGDFDESNEDEKTRLTDMRIINETTMSHLYVAFYSRNASASEPKCFIWRTCLASSDNPTPCEISAVNLKNPVNETEFLQVKGLRFFDDERLDLLVCGIDEKGMELHYFGETKYQELVFANHTISSVITNILTASSQRHSLLLHNYCLITQFKPSHLVTNGLRGLVIILSENRRRMLIFDTNDEEEEEEEEENS